MKVFRTVPLLFLLHTANGAATPVNGDKTPANPSPATPTREKGAANVTTATTATAEPLSASSSSTGKPAPEPPVPPAPQHTRSGYGAGSVFMGIIFGMALMYGLLRLYSYWVNRKFNSDTSYRAY